MLVRVPWWRHLLVALAIGTVVLLAGVGVLGEPARPEGIQQLQVTIAPAPEFGPDALQVTEVIDQRFGTGEHGPELFVPNDFGELLDVQVSSPDAPDAVSTAVIDGQTRIRVGDPDETISGLRRYRLSYVLPEARLARGTLAIDAVGADSDEDIRHVTVFVTGLVLDDVVCTTGTTRSTEPCTASPVAGGLRVAVDRLAAREGITLGGSITEVVPSVGAAILPPPASPETHRGVAALVALGLGVVGAGASASRVRRMGANQVAGPDAVTAAFGPATSAAPTPVPAPPSGPPSGPPAPPGAPAAAPPALSGERTVSDAELAELATIEFAPPPGLEPWQGQVVLQEHLGDDVVTSWFSGAAARGEILLAKQDDGKVQLWPGPARPGVDPTTAGILDALFDGRELVELGRYDEAFGSAWSKVAAAQWAWVGASGWWRGKGPTRSKRAGGCLLSAALLGLFVATILVALVFDAFGATGSYVGLVVLALVVPALVARLAYNVLVPGRTAAGSAAALRTASFRRFLAESEGQHVTWAWQHGLLRQYSAWAVALGTADAWQRAMQAAGVPPTELTDQGPLVAHSMGPVFLSSHTAPAPASSGGSGFSGGGFSGGSVGGGGGGGSHGSW